MRNASDRIPGRRRIGVVIAGVVVVAGCVSHPTKDNTSGSPAVRPKPTPDFLVPAHDVTPTFPLTLSYVPPGVRHIPHLLRDATAQVAFYPDPNVHPALAGATGPPRQPMGLIVLVSSQDQALTDSNYGPGVPVSIRGRPGRLWPPSDDSPSAFVAWQREPGQYLSVEGTGEWSARDELLKVANGLRAGQQTGKAEFQLAVVPAGYVPRRYGLGLVAWSAPSDPESKQAVFAYVDPSPDTTGRRVKVGKRMGWLSKVDTKFLVTWPVSATTYVSVSTPNIAPWTEDAAQAFAAGVTYLGLQPPP